jgi:hypothetical protein
VVEQQNKFFLRKKTYYSRVDEFRSALLKIDSTGVVRRLIDYLGDTSRSGNADLKMLISQNKECRSLLSLKDDTLELKTISLGCDDTLRPQPSIESLDVSDLDNLAGNLSKTRDGLEKLQKLVVSLVMDHQESFHMWVEEQQVSQDAVTALQSECKPSGTIGHALSKAKDVVGAVPDVKKSLNSRHDAIAAMASRLAVEIDAGTIVGTSTINQAVTPATLYFSIDAGLLGSYHIGVCPYLGLNIYCRPINKNAPLRQRGDWWHRFAFVFGVTTSTVADDRTPKTRDGLIGNYGLVLGCGTRLTESFRVGVGVMLFHKKNVSPLLNGMEIAVAPYLSFSFDWNIVKTVAGIGKLFGG